MRAQPRGWAVGGDAAHIGDDDEAVWIGDRADHLTPLFGTSSLRLVLPISARPSVTASATCELRCGRMALRSISSAMPGWVHSSLPMNLQVIVTE